MHAKNHFINNVCIEHLMAKLEKTQYFDRASSHSLYCTRARLRVVVAKSGRTVDTVAPMSAISDVTLQYIIPLTIKFPLVLCSVQTVCWSGALFLQLVQSHPSLCTFFSQQELLSYFGILPFVILAEVSSLRRHQQMSAPQTSFINPLVLQDSPV